MPIRKLSLFSSNASIISRQSSDRGTRPPTYYSTASVSFTQAFNELNLAGYDRESAGHVEVSSVAASSGSGGAVSLSLSAIGDSTSIHGPSGPRYIYYRVFSVDGPIRTANPVYAEDPYLGRILARIVAPPHTTINLRRCLSNAESIDDTIITRLFLSCSSQSVMDDAERVSILSHPGPGSSPNEPLALVAIFPDTFELLPPETGMSSQMDVNEGPAPFEPQYIHYLVYKKHGAIASKQPTSPSDPYVGRLSVDSIPPPHTAISIMRRISNIETLQMSTRSQLYATISSGLPFGEEHIWLFTSNRPGCTPDDPMALVVEPEVPAPDPAPKPAPVVKTVRYPPLSAEIRNRFPTFTKPMQTLRSVETQARGEYNSYWLSYKCGDVVYTNHDLPQKTPYISIFPTGRTRRKQTSKKDAYRCVTLTGNVGYIYANNVKAIEVARMAS